LWLKDYIMATIYTQNNIIYISAMILNEETGKNVRKKKSTKLKDTKANMKHVEERLLPRFEKELREGKITLPRKVSSAIQIYTTMQCKSAPLRNTYLAEISNKPASLFCFNL
jgi:hypothetical protein